MTSNVIQIRLGCKSDTVLIPHSIFENSVQEKGKNVQHIQVVGQNHSVRQESPFASQYKWGWEKVRQLDHAQMNQ